MTEEKLTLRIARGRVLLKTLLYRHILILCHLIEITHWWFLIHYRFGVSDVCEVLTICMVRTQALPCKASSGYGFSTYRVTVGRLHRNEIILPETRIVACVVSIL